MKGYNYIDLFHGIGGFAIGAHLAGMKFENHFCSDIEPYAQELYKLRFPDSIQLGDISKIDTEELKKYGDNWIISGGFPCQDISIAGKGAGIHGKRSGLWFEYWRLINDLRPRFAIMENVGMLVHRGLSEVLGSLAEIGYNAEWQDIRAEDVGAPHKRERIWIVSYPELHGRTAPEKGICIEKAIPEEQERKNGAQHIERTDCVPEAEGNVANTDSSQFKGERIPVRIPKKYYSIRGYCEEVSNTASKRQQGQGTHAESVDTTDDSKRKTDRSYDICETREEQWLIEPAVGRLAHGVSSRVDRLKGLGNAIVPQIAEILFKQIKPYLELK